MCKCRKKKLESGLFPESARGFGTQTLMMEAAMPKEDLIYIPLGLKKTVKLPFRPRITAIAAKQAGYTREFVIREHDESVPTIIRDALLTVNYQRYRDLFVDPRPSKEILAMASDVVADPEPDSPPAETPPQEPEEADNVGTAPAPPNLVMDIEDEGEPVGDDAEDDTDDGGSSTSGKRKKKDS